MKIEDQNHVYFMYFLNKDVIVGMQKINQQQREIQWCDVLLSSDDFSLLDSREINQFLLFVFSFN